MNAPVRQRDWLLVGPDPECAVSGMPSLRAILDAVCAHYMVTRIDICAERRDRRHTTARHVFAYLARALTTKSTATIGRFISRDHSTIVCAYQKIEKLLNADDTLRASIETIKSTLEAA